MFPTHFRVQCGPVGALGARGTQRPRSDGTPPSTSRVSRLGFHHVFGVTRTVHLGLHPASFRCYCREQRGGALTSRTWRSVPDNGHLRAFATFTSARGETQSVSLQAPLHIERGVYVDHTCPGVNGFPFPLSGLSPLRQCTRAQCAVSAAGGRAVWVDGL